MTNPRLSFRRGAVVGFQTKSSSMRFLLLATIFVLCWLATSGAAFAQTGKGTSMFGFGFWRPMPDWDYDGKRILGHVGYDVCLWDAQTGRLIRKFVGHRERIDSVQFSPNGKYALSSSWITGVDYPILSKDTSVRLWDLRTGKEIWKLELQVAGKFSPDGKRLLTFSVAKPEAATANGVVMWDVASGRKLFAADPEPMSDRGGHMSLGFGALAFSPDGHAFLCFLYSRAAILYDSTNGREMGRIAGVLSFNFYGLNGDIATLHRSNNRNEIDIWDSTGERKRQVPLASRVRDYEAGWTKTGSRLVALADEDPGHSKDAPSCGMRIFDVESGKFVDGATCLPQRGVPLVSPKDDRFLMAWGTDPRNGIQKLSMYDLESGRELWQIENSQRLLGFSPDGKTFLAAGRTVTGSGDSFEVYDSESGKRVATLKLQNTIK